MLSDHVTFAKKTDRQMIGSGVLRTESVWSLGSSEATTNQASGEINKLSTYVRNWH